MRKLKLAELNRASVTEFKKQTKHPIILVLDNVRSALNVGSAFRTGDAFAVQHIHLCGITAKPPHKEILKTAIGATESVDWTYSNSTTEVVKELKKQHVTVYAVEQATDSINLGELPEIADNQQVALVFGNEVKGVSEEVMTLVDACVEVPQFGTKHSLNVSVCLGVVVWEFLKKANCV